MVKEIEAKILEVNRVKIVQILERLGAKKILREKLRQAFLILATEELQLAEMFCG